MSMMFKEMNSEIQSVQPHYRATLIGIVLSKSPRIPREASPGAVSMTLRLGPEDVSQGTLALNWGVVGAVPKGPRPGLGVCI